MSLVAVVGDAATTTTLALAAAWPSSSPSSSPARRARWPGGPGAEAREDGDRPASDSPDGDSDVLVLEADPRGGSMAAWLDLPVSPSLSTVVTRAGEGGWPAIDALARVTPSGLRLIPAPVRSIEAVRAVAEADRHVFGVLAGLDHPVVLVDGGIVMPSLGPPPVLRRADVAVVVHRQARQSARAAAVRIERLAEVVDLVVASGVPVVLAVIGAAPFDVADVASFVTGERGLDPFERDVRGSAAPVVELADDPLSAAVLAGRTGVSARRFARLPLARSAAALAATTAAVLAVARPSTRWSVEP